MASCITEQWASNAPQIKLNVDWVESTDTTVKYNWSLQYIAAYAASVSSARSYSAKIGSTTVASGTYNINGVTGTKTIASGTITITRTTSSQTISFSCSMAFNLTWGGTYGGTKSASGSFSVGAKTSYTVSYSANGGSGAPSSQTKWYGTNLTLSSTKPTLTGYSFSSWLSSAQSKTYNPGDLYGYNASTTMTAQWTANTYTVSYNANGGSGAPSSQTKTYGVALTLSITKPTRTNYNFLGWGTSASSTTATYAAGGSYTNNAAITLYAVWELAYTKPRITSVAIYRCDSSGNASDSGTYFYVNCAWACDKTVSSITVNWESTSGTSSGTVSASGTSGIVGQIFGSGAISTDSTYTVSVTVADSVDSTTVTRTLAGTAFPIDILSGGNGIAFGKPAEKPGVADFNFSLLDKFGTSIGNGLSVYSSTAIDPNTTLEHEILTNVNAPTSAYYYITTIFCNSKTVSSARTQIATPYNSSSDYNMYFRYYYSGSWTSWTKVVKSQLANQEMIYGTTTSGTAIEALNLCSTGNNCVVGYGGYASNTGATNIYGNNVNIYTKGNFYINGLSGMVKATNGAISAATAGTDYVAPSYFSQATPVSLTMINGAASQGWYNVVYKSGNVGLVLLAITVSSSSGIANNTTIANLPTGYYAWQVAMVNPSGNASNTGAIGVINGIVRVSGILAKGSYTCCIPYIIAE